MFVLFIVLFKLISLKEVSNHCLFYWWQISDVLVEAGKPCGVESVCLYGGTSKGPQISSLKSGVVRYFILLFD